jgi:hypothetical protein
VAWVHVDRRQIIPDLEPMPDATRNGLVAALRAALGDARHAGIVRRSPKATELWRDLYARMAADNPDSPIVGALTARAEAQVLRFSLLYALIDGARTIEREHLESAWELWRYCRWSAQHIWVGTGTGDPDVDRVAAVLQAGEELTSTALDRMFYGHRDVAEIRRKAVALGIATEVTRPREKRRKRRKPPGGSIQPSTARLLPLSPLLPQPMHAPGRAVLHESASRTNLGQQPHHIAANARIHGEHVDHVGPAVPVRVAVMQQFGRDRVAVGLVEDQHAAQLVPRRR